MPKVTGPCFSLSASKSLKKTITYQKRPSGSSVYVHSQPGSREPFTPSWRQRNQRGIIGLLTAQWQTFSQATKDQWDEDAKTTGEVGTGYHFWLKTAQTNLPYYHNLQGYWSFNIGSSCRAWDISGNNNHGTLKPGCPTNAPLWVPGLNEKFGSALWFDMVNDWVDCVDPPSLRLPDFYSMELWYKREKSADKGALLYHVYNANNNFYLWWLPNTLRLQCVRGGIIKRINLPLNLVPGKYYHIVGTYDGSFSRLYIDGIFRGKGAIPTIYTPAIWKRYLVIGERYQVHDQFLGGIIDEVRIYDRVLPSLEILKHYQLFRG